MVGPRTSEAAVSSVVGTVLMLGITVSVFAGVSVVVLDQFDDEDPTLRSSLGVVRGDGAYLLQHEGGDPIPLDGASLLVGVGAVAREVPLTEFTASTSDGEWWRLGETLCVSCLFPGQEVTGVQFVGGDALLLNEGTVPQERLVDGVDLQVDAPEADPDGLRAGQSTLLRARVTNVGRDATGAAVAMEVLVDGASVGTATGAALDGGTAQWLEVPWTATTGTHAVAFVADPLDAVAEADETDNTQAMTLIVVASVLDPGFAYQDVNLDGAFAEADDLPIDRADLEDGTFDAAANGLVLPPSWGPLGASAISLSGAHVKVHGDLTATGGALSVTATAGDAVLAGDLSTLTSSAVTVQAAGAVSAADALVQSGGAVTVQGASVDLGDSGIHLTTSGSALTLTATGGDLLLDDAVVDVRGAVTASAAVLLSAIDLDLDMRTAGADLGLAATALALTDATVDALGDATLDATVDMDLSGVVLRLSGGYLHATADGALAATGADLEVLGWATLEGGSLSAGGVRLVNTAGGGDLTLLTTAGTLDVPGAVLSSNGAVSVIGETDVDASGATVTTAGTSKTVKVQAFGVGHVDVRDATLTATKFLTLQVVDTGAVPNGWSVHVEGATFQDMNGSADVVPDSAAVGTPLSGGVE